VGTPPAEITGTVAVNRVLGFAIAFSDYSLISGIAKERVVQRSDDTLIFEIQLQNIFAPRGGEIFAWGVGKLQFADSGTCVYYDPTSAPPSANAIIPSNAALSSDGNVVFVTYSPGLKNGQESYAIILNDPSGGGPIVYDGNGQLVIFAVGPTCLLGTTTLSTLEPSLVTVPFPPPPR
jgi:hypothetical protein